MTEIWGGSPESSYITASNPEHQPLAYKSVTIGRGSYAWEKFCKFSHHCKIFLPVHFYLKQTVHCFAKISPRVTFPAYSIIMLFKSKVLCCSRNLWNVT